MADQKLRFQLSRLKLNGPIRCGRSKTNNAFPDLVVCFFFSHYKEYTMSDYKKYQCLECGHIYDESIGDPESGLEPGTRWEDVPENWLCPECGAEKSAFELMP